LQQLYFFTSHACLARLAAAMAKRAGKAGNPSRSDAKQIANVFAFT